MSRLRDGHSRNLELTLSSEQAASGPFEVAREDEIPPGRMLPLLAGKRRIVVYHTADGFFASDDFCPHRGGPLSEGDLLGSEITCPWHLWSFDLRTGLTAASPEVSMPLHRVEIVAGRILVHLLFSRPVPEPL